MVDHVEQLEKWRASGEPLAIARVVSTWRSSPRPAGSAMVVTASGDMMGSVSGGCVEKAVVARARKVLETGESALVKYGVADEDAWEVGLSCGGALSVFIQPFFGNDTWEAIQTAGDAKAGRILLTKLDHTGENNLIDPDQEAAAFPEGLQEDSQQLYRKGRNGLLAVGEAQYFQQSLPPKPKMILIGSAHISSELTGLAHLYGFDTMLIDPRDTFAKKTHFESKPGSVHVNWPHEVLPDVTLDKDTYIVILSHDPKIDDEALKLVLRSPVRYIGALGSSRTHAKRVARLESYGFTSEEINRIAAPIGVDIRSQSAAEIALSIMAQVIRAKNA